MRRGRGQLGVTAGALLAAWLCGCGLGESDDSAPLTIFDNFRVMEPGRAYRSAQLDARTLNLVFNEYGIRTIINLRGENEHRRWYQSERNAASRAGVKLIDIRMSAGKLPSREALLKLYDAFSSAEYPILIHCQAGTDRTGAAAAIWRMAVRGESRAQAARELSVLSGHFRSAHPEADALVAIFQPDRRWIEQEYCGQE